MLTTCYSYIRWSSQKQSKGDTLRRQTDLASQWVATHPGHILDSSTYRDMGLSAFHGANATVGALGRFLEAVEQGKIKKNSCLIVESLDRLTRQQIEDALELFLRIIKSGITIVTLADGELIFRRGELDMAKLILAIAILSRGHNESAVKSARAVEIAKAKREKARNGVKVRKSHPGWLTWTGDKYVPVPGAVETITYI